MGTSHQTSSVLPFSALPADDLRDQVLRRLDHHGAQALEDHELLVLFFPALDPSLILEEDESLAALWKEALDSKIPDGQALRGVRLFRELGRRALRNQAEVRDLLHRPQAAIDYLRSMAWSSAQELAGALYLNASYRLLESKVFFKGDISKAVLGPGPILRKALELEAASFIFFHNHPSGNTIPSQGDVDFTLQLSEAGKLVGVQLLDHLILSPFSASSLREGFPDAFVQ